MVESCGGDERGFRIYAITLKNKMIAAFFCGVTIPQFTLGIYFILLGANNPGTVSFLPRDAENLTLILFSAAGVLTFPVHPYHWIFRPNACIFDDWCQPATVMPTIPLDSFRLCVFSRHHPIEIGYTCISLFFGKLTHDSAQATRVSRSFRLSCIRCNHQLRSQKRTERQRSLHVKTKPHQNDRTRRNHLLFRHFHISPNPRFLSCLCKGANKSRPIRRVSHPFFLSSPPSNFFPR